MTENDGNCISCPANLGALPSLRDNVNRAEDEARSSADIFSFLGVEPLASNDDDRRQSLERLSNENTCDVFELPSSLCHRPSDAALSDRTKTPSLFLDSHPGLIARCLSSVPGRTPSSPERKKSRAHSPSRLRAQSVLDNPAGKFFGGPSSLPNPMMAVPLPLATMHRHHSASGCTEKSSGGERQQAPMRRCVSFVQPPASEDAVQKEKKLKSFNHKQTLIECISTETAGELLRGAEHMRRLYDRVVVIDCRFQYEFDGGHIHVPPHLADWIQVLHIPPHESHKAMDLFFTGGGARPLPAMSIGQDRVCTIFHCEFSQRRGPEMHQKVRSEDRRRVGSENWPQLYYPEMYVLDLGYKSFWESFPNMCQPQSYVTERDPRFADDCVRFNKERQSSKHPKKKPPPRRGLGGGREFHSSPSLAMLSDLPENM